MGYKDKIFFMHNTGTLKHTISQVKFEPEKGFFLFTGSYDMTHMTSKVWSFEDFKPVRTLHKHKGKVKSLDVVQDGYLDRLLVLTVSQDRIIKAWSSRIH